MEQGNFFAEPWVVRESLRGYREYPSPCLTGIRVCRRLPVPFRMEQLCIVSPEQAGTNHFFPAPAPVPVCRMNGKRCSLQST